VKVPYLDLPAQISSLRREINEALAKTLDHCSFCLGPDVAYFEQQFAEFCGVRYAIAVNSGTSALHLALLLLDVGPGDEVITTPDTFIATSWAISYVGARPVYVDIDDATFNINVAQIEKAITSKTKAILPVHLYGLPCDLNTLLEIASKYSLPIVEDAAQAHGALYQGRMVGSFGKIGCFSFYPAKNLGALGEGGALTTNDDVFAARAQSLREHGATQRYHHDEIGYNYRMEGIQGAILGVKLKHLAAWTESRRRVAKRYSQSLANTPLQLPLEPPGSSSAWHLYTVRHSRRDELKKFLEEQEIGCAIHYPLPLHLQKCYAFLGYRTGDFPVSERAANECLSLPIYPEISDEQIDFICSQIHRFFSK
jgi:dTDP-4-amino-4,6-dideoxygalactose transaminase